MKLSALLLASLSVVSANAQYFSAGWTPGAPVPSEPAVRAAAAAAPEEPSSESSGSSLPSLFKFDFEKLIESSPVSAVFNKIGVNISERLEKARQAADFWDHRVPLLTDENYDELIGSEQLTPEEEVSRVWFIVISVSKGQNNGLSKLVDAEFDAAYNKSIIEGDLPDVRWGRMDYLNVTYLTTKWAVWQAPFLVAITDHGQTLRFYKASQVRLSADIIREFLQEEGWRNTEPWNSSFAPGGDYEFLMHYFALVMQKIYNVMVIVPRWLLMLLSGVIGNFVIKLLHKNQANPDPKEAGKEEKKEEDVPASSAAAAEASTTGANTTKSKGKQRKGGKK